MPIHAPHAETMETASNIAPADLDSVSAANVRLSYKFQRLREQLRQAIENGEFAGRLPGERDLGRRFNANAKTINKALSDLSAEGLVVRHIGRGTYVSMGSTSAAPQPVRSFWWVHAGITRTDSGADALYLFESASKRIKSLGSDSLVAISLADLGWQHEAIRKRGMRETDGVVLCGVTVDDSIVAELARRQIPTVTIGVELESLRVEGVVADDADAGFRLTEHLLQLGCMRVAVLHGDAASAVVDRAFTGFHAACKRRRARVAERITTSTLQAWLDCHGDGMSGIIAIGGEAARQAHAAVRIAGIADRVALACLPELGDRVAESLKVTSYETPADRIAEWAVRLLRDWRPGQPPVQVVVPGKVIVRGENAELARREGSGALTEAVI